MADHKPAQPACSSRLRLPPTTGAEAAVVWRRPALMPERSIYSSVAHHRFCMAPHQHEPLPAGVHSSGGATSAVGALAGSVVGSLPRGRVLLACVVRFTCCCPAGKHAGTQVHAPLVPPSHAVIPRLLHRHVRGCCAGVCKGGAAHELLRQLSRLTPRPAMGGFQRYAMRLSKSCGSLLFLLWGTCPAQTAVWGRSALAAAKCSTLPGRMHARARARLLLACLGRCLSQHPTKALACRH